jgi:hypothetical protein
VLCGGGRECLPHALPLQGNFEVIYMEYDKRNLMLAVLADVKGQLDLVGHALNDNDTKRALDRLTDMLNSLKTVAGILQLPNLQDTNHE